MVDKYLATLKSYWGYDEFRGVQRQIIDSIASGRDTLGLMPTGGGKSITFQVPTLAHNGLCLVVTPLIALMKDQVENLRSRGVLAAAIYSGMTQQEIIDTLENCIFGPYRFLYVSPERLSSSLFQTKVRRMPVTLITVDESHCISQWGYDFRPAYLQIAKIRHLLPGVPILALTATATPPVAQDIQRQLEFKMPNCIQMSFARSNLSYVVRKTADKLDELFHILHHVQGSTIVYVRNRKRTIDIARELVEHGIEAVAYHAGINPDLKDKRQCQWQQDEKRVMVATNAFGMGIDKPDVRLVVHYDIPDNIEAYFQEAGRAGRDGKTAFAVMLHAPHDENILQRRIGDSFPDLEYITDVYDALCDYYEMAEGTGEGWTTTFDLDAFCLQTKRFPVPVLSALELLTSAKYIQFRPEHEDASRVQIVLDKRSLYDRDFHNEKLDLLLTELLRHYTGIFQDYVQISEQWLGEVLGWSRHEVYETMRLLTFEGVLHYIPSKKVSTITFNCGRVDKYDLLFANRVYFDKKRRYEQRIQSMIYFIKEEEVCRATVLLRYFGEQGGEPCGQCDICLAKKNQHTMSADEENACADRLMQLLPSSGLTVQEIGDQMPSFRHAQLTHLLYKMVQKGDLIEADGRIYRK